MDPRVKPGGDASGCKGRPSCRRRKDDLAFAPSATAGGALNAPCNDTRPRRPDRAPLAPLTALAVRPDRACAGDYYAGKSIDLLIGAPPGGGYDIYARALARHYGRHIPGQPTIVAKNMPGAASARAAGFISTVAPKDGTAIAALMPGGVVGPLLDEKAETLFDPTKVLAIGSQPVSSAASRYTLFRSSPRKWGPRVPDRGPWIPAFAGMNGVFAVLSPRCGAARSVRELERDYAGDDERGAEPAPEARGVAEKPHPHEEGSGGADAGPHRVGGTERDVPLRQKEQAAADRERDDRDRRADDGSPRLLRPLEPDRPADLA